MRGSETSRFVALSCLLSLTVFLLILGTPAYSLPKTIQVPTDYGTIQEAINHADVGDTVFVYNGTYHEHVTINKSMSLVGQDMKTTIIDGSYTGTAVTITQNDVNLTGFTMQHTNETYSGIELTTGASYNNINGNIVRNNSAGVSIRQFADHNSIIQNSLMDNAIYGISLSGSSNLISENNLTRASFEGLSLFNSSDNVISKNRLIACGKGMIFYDGCSNNRIVENNIENNRLGIYISPPGGNLVYNNSFIDNNKQAKITNYLDGPYCSNEWDNGSRGNYWSDYSGVDFNGDGIGDTPYVVDPADITRNEDRYPVTKGYLGGGLYWVPYLIVATIIIVGGVIGGLLVLRRKRRKSPSSPPPATARVTNIKRAR